MHGNTRFTMIIFSAVQAYVDNLDNLKNMADVSTVLVQNHINYHCVSGTYGGLEEDGYCAYLPANPSAPEYASKLAVIEEQCRLYNHESYLEVAAERTARLVFLDGQPMEFLGNVRISSFKPEAGDYTRFADGRYLQAVG
jgi:hypothetical protein